MILTDDTRPSDFTFGNLVGVQTDDSDSEDIPTVPDGLRQTIGGHCGLPIWKYQQRSHLACCCSHLF